MKRSATLSLGLLLALSTFAVSANADTTWTEDLKAAQKLSKKEGKPILADFTGSDWWGYCKKLKAEVFSTKEFKDWASKNVILMTVDFPRKAQDAKTKAQNKALKTTFKVRGYPTVLVMDGKGGEVGRAVGYGPGTGAKAWIKRAQAILDKAKKAE